MDLIGTLADIHPDSLLCVLLTTLYDTNSPLACLLFITVLFVSDSLVVSSIPSMKWLTVGGCILSLDAYEVLLQWLECISLTKERALDPNLTLFHPSAFKGHEDRACKVKTCADESVPCWTRAKGGCSGYHSRVFCLCHPLDERVKTCLLICESIEGYQSCFLKMTWAAFQETFFPVQQRLRLVLSDQVRTQNDMIGWTKK